MTNFTPLPLLKTLFALVVRRRARRRRLRRLVRRDAACAVAALPLEFEIPRGAALRAARRAARGGRRRGRPPRVRAAGARARARARTSRRAATSSRSRADAARAAGQADARRRHAGGGAPHRRLDLRASCAPRSTRSADLRHDTQGLSDAQLLQQLRRAEAHPEGLFFPDTYLFAQGLERPRGAAPRLPRDAAPPRARNGRRATPSVPYKTPYEALIMASIIEKETGRAAEREHDRRRAGQPPAHRHAAAGRSDRDLRPGRGLRRQPEEEATCSTDGAVQHLHARRPAADADRHARARARCAPRCGRRRPTRSTTSRAATARASSRARSRSTIAPCESTS